MKFNLSCFLLVLLNVLSFSVYSDSNESPTEISKPASSEQLVSEQKGQSEQEKQPEQESQLDQESQPEPSIVEEVELQNEEILIDSGNGKNTDDVTGESQSTGLEVTSELKKPDEDKLTKKAKPAEQAPSEQKVILEYLEQLTRLNKKILQIEDEQVIDQMLAKERNVMDELVALLGKATIDELSVPEKIKHPGFLNSRIATNEKRGNDIAVQRDKIKLAYYQVSRDVLDYLQYLIDASRSYTAADEIVNESVTRLNAARKEIKQYKVPKFDSSSKVFTALKKNYTQLNLAHDTYRDILSYVINNPGRIATTHWFQKFSLLSSIAFFNNFDVLRPLNHKLAPLRIDAGGIIVSLIIITLVVFCYPLAVKGISWLIEKYFLRDRDEHTEEIYHELRRPIFALIVFISLDMATYALLYKTEYKSSLEDLVFVVYAVFFLWIVFKIMDSVVLVQLDKFSKSNKQLRKELVNLGIQVSKGLFVIIALSVLLNRFGISITALMSTLGIGGLAFALAAKDSLSNLLGGVTLLIDNVFSLGDWVKIGEVEGTAVQIGLRSTTIRTFDNALITIPNSVISVSSVRNWNRRAIGRRIKMHVGVTYQSNMDDIRQAVEDIRTMLREHSEIANPKEQFGDKRKQFRLTSREDTQGIKSTQLVYMDSFNDFSIDILIYCFSRSVNWAEWLAVKEDVLFKIANILKQNNLEFAYPTAVRIYKSEHNNDIEEFDMINSKVDSLA